MSATQTTDRFRYNRWVARRTAAAAMILLYALLLWVILQEGPSNWLEVLLVVITAVLSLVYVIISRHSVTRLTIGPEGVSVPYGILRTIHWDEIEQVEYIPAPLLLPNRDRLHLTLDPNAKAPAKIPLPSVLESWLLRRGLTIPLHVLRAPPEHIKTSIGRFADIIETDLRDELLEAKSAKDSV